MAMNTTSAGLGRSRAVPNLSCPEKDVCKCYCKRIVAATAMTCSGNGSLSAEPTVWAVCAETLPPLQAHKLQRSCPCRKKRVYIGKCGPHHAHIDCPETLRANLAPISLFR
eukprot:3493556-Amphidinium_carterae.2